jgi:CheY-like chemotaxis protein
LVIDDDDVARELLCNVLRDEGYSVFDLASPIGATRLIVQKEVRAVVVDVVMPSIRGDRLARLLRGNPRMGSVGVVLVSGDHTVKLESMAKEVGADAVVRKDEARAMLVPAVARAISSRPLGGQ